MIIPEQNLKNMPIYLQIRDSFYQKIRSGEYRAGDKLPSEDDIAASFGVTRVTVNKALSELLAQGYLFRRHGAGTFVSKLRREGSDADVLGFFEAVGSKGFLVESDVLASRMTTPSKGVAEHLQTGFGEKIFFLRRLRRVNQKPVVLQATHIRGHFLEELLGVDYTSCSLYETLKNAGHEVVHARDTVEAINADEEESTLLQVPPGQALLSTRRLGYNQNGQLLELTYSIHRSDQYELEIEYPFPRHNK